MNSGHQVQAGVTSGSGDGLCMRRKEAFAPKCPLPRSSVPIHCLMVFGVASCESSNLDLDDSILEFIEWHDPSSVLLSLSTFKVH